MNIDEGTAKSTSLRMSAGNQVAVAICHIAFPSQFCICLRLLFTQSLISQIRIVIQFSVMCKFCSKYKRF